MMRSKIPSLIVAGIKGGSGKTFLSLGLIAEYKRKGRSIIPFKKGPDYIDAGWLSCAANSPCYNLDQFLIGREKILQSFIRHFGKADCAIIEGNRGLYDGMDEKGAYSTAELAKMLKAPVILIIDCSKATRTVAAIVSGMQRFDRGVDIEGVVLNQIAGARHEKVIRDSIEKYCHVPVLGAFPCFEDEYFPERHMGLTPFHEHLEVGKAISFCAEAAKKYIDLNAIWRIANKSGYLAVSSQNSELQTLASASRRRRPNSKLKIGVIKDSAFQFYYPENLEELSFRGAEIIEISSLKENALPDIDALYIGGGFPETNAIALARNAAFRKSLKKAVEKGLPVYAECGGLMYLGESLIIEGKRYPMAGIFPVKFSLEKKPQAHGYSITEVQRDNPYYHRGDVIKGHEFHYSRVINPEAAKKFRENNIYFAFKMKRGEGIINKLDGLCYKNVFATYTHIHALGAREWADGMIKRAGEYKGYQKC